MDIHNILINDVTYYGITNKALNLMFLDWRKVFS